MADVDGISFLRTTRRHRRALRPGRGFPVGGSRRRPRGRRVAIVAAGITLHEALAAAETLAADGIEARVIDLYSVKPVDAETLRSLSMPIVTVRGPLAGGRARRRRLGAIADADEQRVVKLAVADLPHGQARRAARGGRDRRATGGSRLVRHAAVS